MEVHAEQIIPAAPPATYSSALPTAQRGASSGTGADRTNGSGLPIAGNGSNGNNENGPASTDVPQASGSTTVGSLHAMSLGLLLSSRSASVVWRGPKKTAMVRQFLADVQWPALDYLLIDTPPGTSDEHISLVESLLKTVNESLAAGRPGPHLAGAVVVTTPQAVAVSDVRKELNFCAKTGVRVIGVVENMSGYMCPCCGDRADVFAKGGGSEMAAEFGVPFLGEVPLDALWGELIEEGRRPVYSAVIKPRNEDLDVVQDMEMEPKPREPGLLVDKYRSCSLWPIFDTVAGEVHSVVQRGDAVLLRNR